MSISQIYILIAIVALAAIVIVMILTRKRMKKSLSWLSVLAFLFIVAGITFGESRLLGYGLMGAGLALAVIDIFLRLKKQMPAEKI
jgi:hypothetical protein